MSTTKNKAALLVRVASSPAVGGGHVSRCRALALSALRHMPVVMVLDRDGGDWRPSLEATGCRVVIEGAVPVGPWAASVLDGHDFSADDVAALASYAAPVAVIDDFLDPPSGADLVINAAPGLSGREVAGIPALLGSDYALLGPEYCGGKRKPAMPSLSHVVVTFGNLDAHNGTCLAISALQGLDSQPDQPQVTVAIGSRARHLEDVRKAVKSLGPRAQLRVDESDMAALLRDADLVIGAGGVSLLERMACGVPSITIVTATNQRLAADGAAAHGGSLVLGTVEGIAAVDIGDAVEALARDPSRRSEMGAKAKTLVDGRGCERVADALWDLSRTSSRSTAHAAGW